MDVHSKEIRSRNMQAIRRSDTKPELLLRKALWKKGFRYRKDDPKVFGRPDITFHSRRIAIFVDSEFFHGKNWKKAKYRIKSNRDFWWDKIEKNIKRDRLVVRTLRKDGWKVIRMWDKFLVKNLANCISKIEEVYHAEEIFRDKG
jgi:DNA mismatch endonuclease (patch repair protein)